LTSGWLSEGIEIDWPDDGKGVMAVLPAPALSAFIAVRQDAVDLVGLEHQAVLHTFETVGADPNSVRSFHSSIRRLQCGSGGLASFLITTDQRKVAFFYVLVGRHAKMPDAVHGMKWFATRRL